MSANVDEALLANTVGAYTYRINGSVHHCISKHFSSDPSQAKFSQIYFYDADMQSNIRTGMYPKAIHARILNMFQDFLNRVNPYVKIFQQAGHTLRSEPNKEFNIVLKSNTSKDKTKNTPTVDEIAAIIVDYDQTQFSKRDIVLRKKKPLANQQVPTDSTQTEANNIEPPSTSETRETDLQFINENTSIYDPLAYPLLHLYGEPGETF